MVGRSLAEARTDQRRALAAWDEGVSVAREHRARFFEGFLARDAARVHALHGDPVAALALFDTAIGRCGIAWGGLSARLIGAEAVGMTGEGNGAQERTRTSTVLPTGT